MKDRTAAFKAAFPLTIPVLTGFMFLGIAYGILMQSKGYGVGWTFLMSVFGFAGSAQYVAIVALTSVFNPLNVFLLTLMINARHLFYGISMLEKYTGIGKMKPYLIYGLIDETFSIVGPLEAPTAVNRGWFYFWITFLNHFYWVGGSVLGSLIGSLITFNTKGIDFVLTALFVVIFLSQWQDHRNRRPALIGLGASVFSLAVFGASQFVIPAMAAILLILTAFRSRLAPEELP